MGYSVAAVRRPAGIGGGVLCHRGGAHPSQCATAAPQLHCPLHVPPGQPGDIGIGALRCSGSVLPLGEGGFLLCSGVWVRCCFSLQLSCRGGGRTDTPSTAPHCCSWSMGNIITPAKANPCRPWLLGRAPRKAAFPCKVRGHEYLMPEEGISFRRMLHELWRVWEGHRAVVLLGQSWGCPGTSGVPQTEPDPIASPPHKVLWMGGLRESAPLHQQCLC